MSTQESPDVVNITIITLPKATRSHQSQPLSQIPVLIFLYTPFSLLFPSYRSGGQLNLELTSSSPLSPPPSIRFPSRPQSGSGSSSNPSFNLRLPLGGSRSRPSLSSSSGSGSRLAVDANLSLTAGFTTGRLLGAFVGPVLLGGVGVGGDEGEKLTDAYDTSQSNPLSSSTRSHSPSFLISLGKAMPNLKMTTLYFYFYFYFHCTAIAIANNLNMTSLGNEPSGES